MDKPETASLVLESAPGSDHRSHHAAEQSGAYNSHDILAQVERIAESLPFRNSKRYPALLRHIVDEVLAGRGDELKERCIGIEVFGRSNDYDTTADPVVRTSAGEVRKRLAQYYQSSGHEGELRIDIPLGSYVPRFDRSDQSAQPKKLPAHVPSATENISMPGPERVAMQEQNPGRVLPELSMPNRVPAVGRSLWAKLHLALLYLLVITALSAWGVSRWSAARASEVQPGVAMFWSHMLDSGEPTLIVLGVHSFDAKGNDISDRTHVSLPQAQETLLSAMTRSDMIHLGDLISYSKLTTLLAQSGHAFRTQGAADTTLEQLRAGRFILIGGFNNFWTMKLTSQLRFHFFTLNGRVNVIQDAQHPERMWTIDTSQSALKNTLDYALVSSYLDPMTNQHVLVSAGIGKSGTEAASDFITDPKALSAAFATASAQKGDNIEVLLSTEVIEGKHSVPHVVEVYRW